MIILEPRLDCKSQYKQMDAILDLVHLQKKIKKIIYMYKILRLPQVQIVCLLLKKYWNFCNEKKHGTTIKDFTFHKLSTFGVLFNMHLPMYITQYE